MHDTEVLLQVSLIKLGKTRQLHVALIPRHPTLFKQRGTLTVGRMRLKKCIWNDVLEIPWSDVIVTYEEEMIVFNPKIYVPIIGKLTVRELLTDMDAKAQLILLRANNYVVLETAGVMPQPSQ